ncbi:MAG: holo-ACP synthase [Planctomycetota bacterium]
MSSDSVTEQSPAWNGGEASLAFTTRRRILLPMSLRHGIDLVECSRIEDVWRHHTQRFLDRVLTPAEQELAKRFKNPVPYLAGRWAAKEAILKMLGTGWRGSISWTDMEILPDPLGQPLVTLSGECKNLASRLGIHEIQLSITHTAHYASASAIGILT